MADDPKNTRVVALQSEIDARVRGYWLPKLREARASAAASRTRVTELETELGSITPDAVLSGMVDAWDKDVKALDDEFKI